MKPFTQVAYILLAITLTTVACKTGSKARSTAAAGDTIPFVHQSNISLYDKPLDTIKKHVTGRRWQLVYSIGGMTGDDKNTFTTTFYTLTKAGKLVTEKDGQTSEASYNWKLTRDIFTGDSTYVISGIVQWKVEGIYDDTLRLADNYVDGYGYALVPAK